MVFYVAPLSSWKTWHRAGNAVIILYITPKLLAVNGGKVIKQHPDKIHKYNIFASKACLGLTQLQPYMALKILNLDMT